jgi:hypothetical protein
MDFSLEIAAQGDTTARELVAASEELRNVLERVPGVDQVATQPAIAPDQAKGVGAALGHLLLSVAPTALKAVLQALQSALLPHPATKVLIRTKDGKFSFEFDPKKISLKELVDAADRLRTAAPSP